MEDFLELEESGTLLEIGTYEGEHDDGRRNPQTQEFSVEADPPELLSNCSVSRALIRASASGSGGGGHIMGAAVPP